MGAAVRGDGLQDADLVAGRPRALEHPLGRLRLGRMRRRRLPLLLLGRRLGALGRQRRQRPRRLLAAGRRGRHGETLGGNRVACARDLCRSFFSGHQRWRRPLVGLGSEMKCGGGHGWKERAVD